MVHIEMLLDASVHLLYLWIIHAALRQMLVGIECTQRRRGGRRLEGGDMGKIMSECMRMGGWRMGAQCR